MAGSSRAAAEETAASGTYQRMNAMSGVRRTDALEPNVLHRGALLSAYEGELRAAVRVEGKADGWMVTWSNAFVIGWNTDLVKPGDTWISTLRRRRRRSVR
jgi:hypothetical protein